MNGFLKGLDQPEYLHTLLNPLPVYGLILAIIAAIVALFVRNRSAEVTALVLIFISALSAWPVAHYGEEAYDRVLSMSDNDGSAWLAAHEHRADQLVWIFYLTAAVALSALILPRKFAATTKPLFFASLLLALAAFSAGAYIGYAGGKIRHKEFRLEPPPPKPAKD